VTDIRVEEAFYTVPEPARAPASVPCLLVYAMGLLSAGFGVLTMVRMFASASIEEQLGWMAAAWVAWSAVIAISLWSGARSCSGSLFADLRAAWSDEAR
jgi:hypothetical protein